MSFKNSIKKNKKKGNLGVTEARPIINFFDSDSRKSSSAYRAVWMDKNTKTEVEEKIIPSASEIANTMNNLSQKKIGMPLSLLPPGTV